MEDRKTKVLVVDDDRSMVKTICDILKVKGYEASEAYTGEAAVEKVKSDHPDCVLMNIRMPGMDGIDEVGNSTEKGMKIGTYTCLYKPFVADELIESTGEISRMKLRAVLGETL